MTCAGPATISDGPQSCAGAGPGLVDREAAAKGAVLRAAGNAAGHDAAAAGGAAAAAAAAPAGQVPTCSAERMCRHEAPSVVCRLGACVWTGAALVKQSA